MNPNKTLIIAIAIVAIGVLIFTPSITGGAVIKSGDTISLEYTGKLTDGTVFDTSIGSEPLEFVAGAKQVITGFDNAVLGMKIGEEKTFTILPEEAYGSRQDALIIDMNKTQLTEMIGIEPYVGMELTSENGPVVVVDLNDENATIDLNHPLAGKELIFTVKILKIN